MHKNTPLDYLTFTELLNFLAVFVIVLTATKFGEYVFFTWDTAPAFIWPTTGISMAIVWLYGYRYTIPIFFGLVLAFATGPFEYSPLGLFMRSAGYLISYVTFVGILKRLKFDGLFSHTRSILIFLVVLMAVSNILPFFDLLTATFTGNLTITPYLPPSFAWAGHLLSSIILFPLIVSWARTEKMVVKRDIFEIGFTLVLILISVYFLFWTPIRLEFLFFFFSIAFFSFFWIGFRFSTRILAFSMLMATFFGTLGLFVAPVPGLVLGEQLFITELFLFFVIPIFYTISALVKERTQTIEKLQLAMENIERENIAKNEFIAVLAHELRNPLAPVKSTLEILSLGELDPDIQNLVVRARQQVKAMQRLLNDLLDITRVSQGKFQLRLTQVNLCELIKQCIESTRYVFKDRGHTISLDTECENGLQLAVDPIRFEQVLVNILMNAAKYTDPGGAISVRMRVIDGRVQISVSDNGIGIEPENLENIFEPFWQMKKTGVSSFSGIGVGLWLTKRIVEMHGGTIRVESEGRGKGSTFIVTIPILIVEAPMIVSAEAETTPLPRFRVLVGDDNKPAADSIAKLLMMKGHEARVAYSGREVLDAVERVRPEIILLDIALEDMTGYEVTRSLRSNGFSGKIFALSGYGQEEDRKEALRAGFDHYFTKPMSIDTFEAYVSSMSA